MQNIIRGCNHHQDQMTGKEKLIIPEGKSEMFP